MALADIIKRIERDTSSSVAALVAAAEDEAARVRHEAQASAEERREHELALAARTADEDARTRLASARLRGRDRVLAEKRELIDRVLRAAVERLYALPDEAYAALIAREVDRAARGGEQVLLGHLDTGRLQASLPAALASAGADVDIAGTTQDIERGVVLQGPRMRVEISPDALMQSHRTRLESLVGATLFETGETQ